MDSQLPITTRNISAVLAMEKPPCDLEIHIGRSRRSQLLCRRGYNEHVHAVGSPTWQYYRIRNYINSLLQKDFVHLVSLHP